MTVTGSVFASSYTTTSDERIKKNISLANISSAYETVAAVQMHEYEYNRSTNPRTRWGFIAQQLEEVIPEAVQTITGNYTAEGERIDKENSKNEVLAHTDQKYVSKEKMFQCLFAAFQEAQKKIADLETRMVKLEGQA
jgi:predicted  nucleic acid-binding Zn-ribbon protein